MPKHQETRILPYSSAQMFDLVADIESYPEFLPWCKAARITSKTSKTVTADLIIGYKIFSERFTSEVSLSRPHAISVLYKSGPLSRLSNEWVFKAQGRKACEILFNVDFDFRSPLLKAAANMFFDKALLRMVAAFEGRAKDLYD